jgi:glycosyltransferase involved in cell wall biosynthesis
MNPTTAANPLVTIITPTYNRADYLRGVIESVLAQDYPKIEYIVLDDGSTDDTQTLLHEYDGRLKWETHANMGEARTVNKGWSMASGDIVAVINSDDPALPGLVSAMVEYMTAHPDVWVVYPDWIMIDAKGDPIQTITTYDYDYLDMLRWHHCKPGPGTFIRRQAFERVGMRDTDFRYVGDFEFWLRAGIYGTFARLPQVLATFRFHPGSASNAAKGLLMAEEHIRMLDKFYARTDITPAMRRVRREAYSAASYIAAIQCMSDRAAARRYFLRSIFLHPNSRPNGLPRSWDLMGQFILPDAWYQRAKNWLIDRDKRG